MQRDQIEQIKKWLSAPADYNAGVFLFAKITGKKATADSLHKYPDLKKLKNYLSELLDTPEVIVQNCQATNLLYSHPVADEVTPLAEIKDNKKIVAMQAEAALCWKIKGDSFAKLKATADSDIRLKLAEEITSNARKAIQIWNEIEFYELNSSWPVHQKAIVNVNIQSGTFADALNLRKEYNRLSTKIIRAKKKLVNASAEEVSLLENTIINLQNERERIKQALNEPKA